MSDITRDYSFGGWLKEFRCRKGITLREAARILPMDSGNLSKLERGLLDPPKSAYGIKKICDDLGFGEFEYEMLLSTAWSFHVGKLKERFKP